MLLWKSLTTANKEHIYDVARSPQPSLNKAGLHTFLFIAGSKRFQNDTQGKWSLIR